jgi:hypothetical protein
MVVFLTKAIGLEGLCLDVVPDSLQVLLILRCKLAKKEVSRRGSPYRGERSPTCLGRDTVGKLDYVTICCDHDGRVTQSLLDHPVRETEALDVRPDSGLKGVIHPGGA